MKLVSVIIPVYGVEDYIAATVQSALKQTYEHFELLIVDDGSPDRSREICQQFQDPRIKIIEQKNQGVAASRNKGIRAAQGDFIAFLDGDDLWLPEKLEKHIKHLSNSPKVGLSFSRFAFIDEAGNSLGIVKMSKITNINTKVIFCKNPVGNPSCVVVRRETIDAIKFFHNNDIDQKNYCYFDEELRNFEDVELWLRIAVKTDWRIEGIPEALTLYRINPKGASVNLRNQLDDLPKMLQKTATYAPDVSEKYAKVLKAYTLRKLAQWAVRLRKASMAKKMIHHAFATYWQMMIEEPFRTLIILGAIYSLFLLPRSLYLKAEFFALKFTGTMQKMILPKNQNKINH